jgi:hypothetical protein
MPPSGELPVRYQSEKNSVPDGYERLDQGPITHAEFSVSYVGKRRDSLAVHTPALQRIIHRGGGYGWLPYLFIHSSQQQADKKSIDGVNQDGSITSRSSARFIPPILNMHTPAENYSLSFADQTVEFPAYNQKASPIKHIPVGWKVEIHDADIAQNIQTRFEQNDQRLTKQQYREAFAKEMDRTLKMALLHISLYESLSFRDRLDQSYMNTGRGLLAFTQFFASDTQGVNIAGIKPRYTIELLNHLFQAGLLKLIKYPEGIHPSEFAGASFAQGEFNAAHVYRMTQFPDEYKKAVQSIQEQLFVRYRMVGIDPTYPLFKSVLNTAYELARHPRTQLIRAVEPLSLTG